MPSQGFGISILFKGLAGLIKILLVAALLNGKPARTIFDMFVMLLIWHEYRAVRRKRCGDGACRAET